MAEEEKKLLGSELKEKLLNQIGDVGQSISQRAQEDDPDSWSDEAARLAVGTAKTVGAVAEAPVIKQVLQVADIPFYLLRQSAGGVLEHGFGVDPWYGQTAVGIGEVALGGKGLVTGAKKLRHAQQMRGLRKASRLGKLELQREFGIIGDELLVKQELGYRMKAKIDGQGSLFDDAADFRTTDTPSVTPAWGPAALSEAVMNPRYAQRYVEYLQESGKTGYETLKLFKTNILNKMPDKGKQLFRLFNEADYREGMIEHLVAKGSYMDWYWEPWGLNKGDRHALSNVRILFNDRFDRFKTTVEGIIRKSGYQSSPNLADRIIVGVEHAGQEIKKVSGIRVQDIRNPGNIVLKRAGSGRVLGQLGQYLDALYPQGKAAIKLFKSNLEKYEGVKGGKAIIEWRKKILKERIDKIIAKHGDLPKKDWLAREKIQNAINEDMVEFRAKYHWLPQPTRAKRYFKEIINKKTGPIPSKTESILGTFTGSSGLPGGG